MSAAGNVGPLARHVATVSCRVVGNLIGNSIGGLKNVTRAPRRDTAWSMRWSRERIMAGFALGVVAFVWTLLIFDIRAIEAVRHLPPWVHFLFVQVTEFGKSGWYLWPLGIVLFALAATSPSLPWPAVPMLGAIGARAGFLFAAVAVPGGFTGIVKYLIGRGRPNFDNGTPFTFDPFVWQADYASLPSGHTTNAVAIAVAVGSIWPRARPVVWLYAAMIAISRIIVTAHHPSDVLAGAIVGFFGALLVRDYFASRRLAFKVGTDGTVRPMSHLSRRRLMATINAVVGTNGLFRGRFRSEPAK